MFRLVHTCWWICILTFDFYLAQKIILQAYNQSDCITSCTHGLISDMDYVVFKSEVDITGDTNLTTVFYQLMKQNEDRYKTICNIDISVECNDVISNPICGCRKIGNYLLYITIVYKAHYSNSGASIVGTVVRSKDHEPVRSDVQKFPLIYASDNTNVMLQINNKNIDLTSESLEHIKENYLGVIFTCSSPATPCLTEFSTDDSTDKFNGSGKQFYYRFFNISKTLTLTIKSAACRLDGNLTVLSKKIQIDLESKPEKDSSSVDRGSIILYTIMTLSILLIILLITTWCVNKKSLSKKVNIIMESIHNKQDLVSHAESNLKQKSSAYRVDINIGHEGIPLLNEPAVLNEMDNLKSKHDNTLEDDASHDIRFACEDVTSQSRVKDMSLPDLSSGDDGIPLLNEPAVLNEMDNLKSKHDNTLEDDASFDIRFSCEDVTSQSRVKDMSLPDLSSDNEEILLMAILKSKHDKIWNTLEDDASHEISNACEVGTRPSRIRNMSLPVLSSVFTADFLSEMQKAKVADEFEKNTTMRSVSANYIFQPEDIKISDVPQLKKTNSSIYYSINETQTLTNFTDIETDLGVTFKK